MGNQLKWRFDESPEKRPSPDGRDRSRAGAGAFWITVILCTILVIGGWAILRRREERLSQTLTESTQALLDLRHEAVAGGDGELFFALQDDDAEMVATQLMPENLDFYRARPQITRIEKVGEMLHANAVWQENGRTYQRVIFFTQRGNQFWQVAMDPVYWGDTQQIQKAWGQLDYHDVDELWVPEITSFIRYKTEELCAASCLPDKLPVTVTLRPDFANTAEPGHVFIPSPRLLGLDEAGRPSDRFLLVLEQRLADYLTPATIRFAVPPPGVLEGQTLLPYENLAEQFMAQYPGITVELFYLDEIPENPSTLAFEFDGAAIPPTINMVAAGHVHDLTDYVNSDPVFDKADFYEQIWQGTLWKERNWFIPESAEMNILYFDKMAYRAAGYAEPSMRWTWAEMAEDVSSIVGDQPQTGTLNWGFLDVGLDSLFSYAYNWNTHCEETATVYCQTPLKTENVAAALDWYGRMASQPGQMPDLSDALSAVSTDSSPSTMENMFTEEHLILLLLNFQGSRRKAAVWVDRPVNYEFNLLLSPVGVASFPGSDRFDGITPLRLNGSYISRYSARPLAVWQWLKFLSRQSPSTRRIPARPSVATEAGFWSKLPRPLGEIMRSAFPFARPVTIEDATMITWEQVSAVVGGELSPAQAATKGNPIQWFGE